MPAAWFDVDGTLVDTTLLHPTWWYLTHQRSLRESAWRVGKALLQGPVMAYAEATDRRLFNEMLFAHYAGMSEDRLIYLADDVFERVIRPRIYPGTADLVKKCQDAGQRVVFVTGSLVENVTPLARHLGVTDVIANRLEIKDGYATGKLLRPVVAGPTKARLIADDARAHGEDLGESFAYTDSYSDVPMLSVVGNPCCVHPDRKLAALARAYSWPVLDLRAA